MGNIRLLVSIPEDVDWMYGEYFIIPLPPMSKEERTELKSKYKGFRGDIVSSERTEKAYYEK